MWSKIGTSLHTHSGSYSSGQRRHIDPPMQAAKAVKSDRLGTATFRYIEPIPIGDHSWGFEVQHAGMQAGAAPIEAWSLCERLQLSRLLSDTSWSWFLIHAREVSLWVRNLKVLYPQLLVFGELEKGFVLKIKSIKGSRIVIPTVTWWSARGSIMARGLSTARPSFDVCRFSGRGRIKNTFVCSGFAKLLVHLNWWDRSWDATEV